MTLPCNICGSFFSSNNICKKCNAVYYCTKDCLSNDWDRQGTISGVKCDYRVWHKKICKRKEKIVYPAIANYHQECLQFFKRRKHEPLFTKVKKIYSQSKHFELGNFQSKHNWVGLEKEKHDSLQFRIENLKKRFNGNSLHGEFGTFIQHTFKNTYNEQIVLRNHPPIRLNCQPGCTYVGIGYVDLYQMLISDFPPLESISENNPIRFEGFDVGFNQTARARIIWEMIMDPECSNQSILQVWFSTVLDAKSFASFIKVCLRQLEFNKVDPEVYMVMSYWINNTHTVDKVQGNFRNKIRDHEYLLLNCLRNERDRMEYLDYIYYGRLFLDDTQIKDKHGNPSFNLVDVALTNRPRSSIFFHLDMKCFEDYDKSLFNTLETYLDTKLTILRELAQRKKLVTKFSQQHFGCGLKESKQTYIENGSETLQTESVRKMKPAVIDWSNIPDYYNWGEFIHYMESSGAKNTIHLMHSVSWHYTIVGAGYHDFTEMTGQELNMEKTYKFCRNKYNMIQAYDMKQKSFMKKFLVPNSTRLFPVSLINLVYCDVMKEVYVRKISELFNDTTTLRIVKFGTERHWDILSRSELSSFDLIFAGQKIPQRERNALIETHLKI